MRAYNNHCPFLDDTCHCSHAEWEISNPRRKYSPGSGEEGGPDLIFTTCDHYATKCLENVFGKRAGIDFCPSETLDWDMYEVMVEKNHVQPISVEDMIYLIENNIPTGCLFDITDPDSRACWPYTEEEWKRILIVLTRRKLEGKV